MSGLMVLYKKEVADFLKQPMFYVVGAIFSVIIGWVFFNALVTSQNLTSLTLSETVIKPLFIYINLLFQFIIPLLTMKTFTAEDQMGTLDLLLRSRLSHRQIIGAKFLALVTQGGFFLSLTLICPIILFLSGHEDWGLVFSCYLGVLLTLSSYAAAGVFFSSLSKHPIFSALMTFGFLLVSYLTVFTAQATQNYIVSEILRFFSFGFHFEAFLRGQFVSYHLFWFFSLIGYFLYMTHLSLERRKW